MPLPFVTNRSWGSSPSFTFSPPRLRPPPSVNISFAPMRVDSHPALSFENYPECQFTSDSVFPVTEILRTADKIEFGRVVVGKRSNVYQGKLRSRKRGPKIKVVLKVGERSMITEEAACYMALDDLQGYGVPLMMGLLYPKVDKDSDKELACLVLEHVGYTVEGDMAALPKADKARILHTLSRIHRKGFDLPTFGKQNVFQKNGEYSIIGLSSTIIHNPDRCRWTYNFLTAGDNSVVDYTTRCTSIRKVVYVMKFWDEGSVLVEFKRVSRVGMPTQSIIWALAAPALAAISPWDLPLPTRIRLLVHFYRAVRNKMAEGYTLDDVRLSVWGIMRETKELWGKRRWTLRGFPERDLPRDYVYDALFPRYLSKGSTNPVKSAGKVLLLEMDSDAE